MASPTRSSTVSFWNFFRGDFLIELPAPSSDSLSQSESWASGWRRALVEAWQRGLFREYSARLKMI